MPGPTARFDFAWDRPYRIAGLLFGVTSTRAWVEVTPSELRVQYGFWSLRSALSNIAGVTVTDSYAFLKTAGPPHLSMSDRGISFATNGRRGLCVAFDQPVPGIDPSKRIKHPGATLTVEDIDGLAEALGHAVVN